MTKTLSEGDLHGLVRLLGDEDEWTYQVALGTILELGEAARPYLADGLTHADPAVRQRVQTLLDNFAWERLRWEWQRFAAERDPDLETGLLLVGRFRDPDLDTAGVRQQLDDLALELRAFLRPGQEVSVAGPTLARFFHERHGFAGADPRYFTDPDASYLQQVLSTRRGLPISLSCVYVLVGRRIGLPIAGVGVPLRFLVRYGAPEGTHVYVDPFDNGRLLTAQSCMRWLAAHNVQPDLGHLATTPDRWILARVLANLINHYATRQDLAAAERLSDLRQILTQKR